MMYGSREKFEYFQCSNCGCLQIENIPADIARYYPSGYYSYSGDRADSLLKRKLINLRDAFAVFDVGVVGGLLHNFRSNDRLRALARLSLKSDQRLLDVGCGSGTLLRSLQAIGFKNLLGVDPFIIEDMDYGNGLRIEKKELVNARGVWDVVMFHHSFEHILNQLETLQNVGNILDGNGTCLIRIPTVSSFAWRHYGVNWVQLDAPRHFFLHSVQSMAILANRAGFYIEQVVFDSDDFQFWGSELYAKDIPLVDPGTRKPISKATVFSRGELRKYSVEAGRLNDAQDGDQAVFYLKKIAGGRDGSTLNSLPKGCFNVTLPHVGESDVGADIVSFKY